MRFKLTLLLFLSFTLSSSMIIAQNVTGTVTDDTGPLPEVNVVVQGTTTGTTTDIDGKYSIKAKNGDVLLFSHISMASESVTVDSNVIDVSMTASDNSLDEVIVVGYGTRKKRDITSAVSQITTKEIEASVQASPEFALQGTTSGILVQSASGDPNARPTIRVRGVGTLGFNDPLYVIDGVPISEFGAGATAFKSPEVANDIRGTQNILNLINPSDIASISVLKDAAATAVYGMRASNGVILIETKRGKGNRTSFNFNVRTGIRSTGKKYDVLNTKDYTALLTESYVNSGETLPPFLDPADPTYLGNGETYDWQSAIENKVALMQDYNFSVQNGNEKANFFFSGALSSQESTLKYNELRRYTATLTSDFKITDWLKIGETLRITHSENEDSKGVSGGMNFISQMLKPAWQPIYDASDPTGYARAAIRKEVDPTEKDLLWGQSTGTNNLALGEINSNKYNILRNLGSVYTEITPLEGLILKGTLGLDWNKNKREWILSKKTFLHSTTSADITNYVNRDLTNFSVLTEFLASYTKEIKNHNFNVLFNLSRQKIGTDWVQSSGNNPLFEDLDRVDFGTTESQSIQSIKERKILTGELYKFSYNYNSKYYLDASYRRDGSTVFAPGNRFGDFYGASAAWRISDEPFMEAAWMDDLKVRASWGQTGNQETEAFSYLASISLTPALAMGNTPDTITRGGFQPGIPNEDLVWETSTTTNIGFDGTVLDSRLNFSFDYYNKLTDGILQPIPLPATLGYQRNTVVNLAEVSNKGIELQMNWADEVTEDFGYNFGLNLTTVKNKVEKLVAESANGRVLGIGSYYGLQLGESIGFIYGYQMEGIFQTQAEVDSWKATHTDGAGTQASISPGDVRFADLYGNPTQPGEFKSNTPDGVINDNDKTYLGKTIPGYYYGFNMGAKYKQFDVSLQWQGVGDVQKVNQAKAFGESLASHSNQLASAKDRWTPTNPSNSIPRALHGDVVANTRFSSRFVEDADYLRLQNLQIGYNFSENLLNKIKLQNLRLYLSGSNVALFTKYSGLDPEVNLLSEADYNPPATTWLLGINLTF